MERTHLNSISIWKLNKNSLKPLQLFEPVGLNTADIVSMSERRSVFSVLSIYNIKKGSSKCHSLSKQGVVDKSNELSWVAHTQYIN